MSEKLRLLKTRFYPVDVERRVIYNDPQRTEGKCSLSGKYRGHNTIGVKGARIIEHTVYLTFMVTPALASGSQTLHNTEG